MSADASAYRQPVGVANPRYDTRVAGPFPRGRLYRPRSGPPAPFIVLASSPTSPSTRLPILEPRYLQALLAPQAHRSLVEEIDAYLADRSYRRDVAFDIEVISFGSNLSILGRLRSNKLLVAPRDLDVSWHPYDSHHR